jgi:ATP synthase protein I
MDRITDGDRARANAELQDNLQRAEPRIVASYALVGAILLAGAVGYGVDYWAGSAPWGLLTGLIIGFVAGFANLIASVRR